MASAKDIRLRFGSFEIDTDSRELRKRGLRLRLQEKPFQVLELLLERPGEVVTREELRDKLWPGVFVGFDRNLNTAINTLRYTLGDSARSPRFIETCQRRGYRFIAPVEGLGNGDRKEASAEEAFDTVAVLPFRGEGKDPQLEYFIDGLTESLIDALSQLPGIRVMARSTVARFMNGELDPCEVGRQLSVCAVITGSLFKHIEMLGVDIEIVDVQHGWRLWGARYHIAPGDVLNARQDISREVSEKLHALKAHG